VSDRSDLASENSGADVAPSSGKYTPRQIKEATLELLKFGFIEEARKPHVYRTALMQQEAIARILEPLDLAMKVDDIRAIAYVAVAGQIFEAEDDEWSHPLVRRQRLNLEQSLLVAILRQHFIVHEQEAGVGASEAHISLDGLLPRLRVYLGDPGSDSQENKRLRNLLEQLKVHGIVSEIDANDLIAIRPIIAHLANPESLQNLLVALRAEVAATQRALDQDAQP
jgi:hypothetical protein